MIKYIYIFLKVESQIELLSHNIYQFHDILFSWKMCNIKHEMSSLLNVGLMMSQRPSNWISIELTLGFGLVITGKLRQIIVCMPA